MGRSSLVLRTRHRCARRCEAATEREGTRRWAVRLQVPKPACRVVHRRTSSSWNPPQDSRRLPRRLEPPSPVLHVPAMRAPIDKRVQRLVVLPDRQVEDGWSRLLRDHADAVTVLGGVSPQEAGPSFREPVDRVERGNEALHRQVVEWDPQPRDVGLRENLHPDRLRLRDINTHTQLRLARPLAQDLRRHGTSHPAGRVHPGPGPPRVVEPPLAHRPARQRAHTPAPDRPSGSATTSEDRYTRPHHHRPAEAFRLKIKLSLRTATPGGPRGPARRCCWRWRWDLNPRRLAPHTLSRSAGTGPGTATVVHTCDAFRRWRSADLAVRE